MQDQAANMERSTSCTSFPRNVDKAHLNGRSIVLKFEAVKGGSCADPGPRSGQGNMKIS